MARFSAVGVPIMTVRRTLLLVARATILLRRTPIGTSVSVSCSNIFPDYKFKRICTVILDVKGA